jgi:ribose transport system substrate-binding protein
LFVLAAVMLLGAACSASAADKVLIGVSIPTADHGFTGGVIWWANKAIENCKNTYKDVDFLLITAESATKQVGDVEDMMVKGVQAIVIFPHESGPLTPVMKKAREAGIFCTILDRGLTDESIQNMYVAGDNPGMGRVSAEWVGKELGGKGEIVVIEGIPTVLNSERVDTFNAIMKEKFPGIKILDSQPGYWNTQKALEVMENYLQKYAKIDAVWCQDDDMLKGVLQAYKESGRSDIQFFLGGAGAKEIIKMVMDGDPLVRADVTYPPMLVATGINATAAAMQGKNYSGLWMNASRIILQADLITKENAKNYYEPDSIF